MPPRRAGNTKGATHAASANEPKDDGRLASAEGRRYEPHAIRVYHEARRATELVWPAERAPRVLLVMAEGKECTPHELRAAVARDHAPRVDAEGVSAQKGLDGIGVKRAEWEKADPAALVLNLIECKHPNRSIEPSDIASNLLRIKINNDRGFFPFFTLISPQGPTPYVLKGFSVGRFEHFPVPWPIAQAAVAPSVAPPPPVELLEWQDVTAGRVVRHWKGRNGRMCKVLAAIAMGKTLMGLEALRRAEAQPVKIFVVHRIDRVAPTTREAARLGIEAINLTCNRTASDAADAVDEDVDAEQPVEDNEACQQIRAGFLQRVKDATTDKRNPKPVWIVICHYTLRIMTLPNVAFFENEAFDGVGTAVVIDEWHLLHRNGNVFTGLLASEHTRTLLMTGTLPKLSHAAMQPKPTQAVFAQLRDAPTVKRIPMSEGVRLGRLVPVRVEAVLAVDGRGKAGDAAKEPLEAKAKATAAWIVQNALRTVAVYTTSIYEADAFRALLKAAVEAELQKAGVADPTAWSKVVHSNLSSGANRLVLETFMRATPTARLEEPWCDPNGRTCDAHYCFLTSVGKLKEGFDFPALQAVVMLNQPGNSCAAVQIAGRVMRAHPGKTIGRVLVFSTDDVACNLWAQVAQEYDDTKGALSFGFVPRTLDEYAAAWTPGSDVQEALRDASQTFRQNVDEQFKKLVIADMASYTDQIIEAFITAFPNNAPWSKTNAKRPYKERRQPEVDRNVTPTFSIFVGGQEIVLDAHTVYNGWRQEWHQQGTRYSTTEEQKERIRELDYWNEPWLGKKPPAKLRMSAQITAFLAKFSKRKPGPKERFEYRIPRPNGGYDTGSNLAGKWLSNVRQSWHEDADASRGSHDHPTTEEQKQRLRDGLKEKPWSWKDPKPKDPNKPKSGSRIAGVSQEEIRGAAIAAVIALNLEEWPSVKDGRTFKYTVGGVPKQARLGQWLHKICTKWWDTLTDAQKHLLESQPFWKTRRPWGVNKGTKRARSGTPVAASSSTGGGVPKRARSYSLENSDDED